MSHASHSSSHCLNVEFGRRCPFDHQQQNFSGRGREEFSLSISCFLYLLHSVAKEMHPSLTILILTVRARMVVRAGAGLGVIVRVRGRVRVGVAVLLQHYTSGLVRAPFAAALFLPLQGSSSAKCLK